MLSITHGYRYADGRALCLHCAAMAAGHYTTLIISEFICDECLEVA